MHKWKLLLSIHLAYDTLITSYAFKTTVANGQFLVFSLQNNSLLEKRHADHHFCFQMFESQQFRTSGESKALSARRSWVIVMCSVGETFYSPSISPRSWNNWLFILEYSLVLAAMYSVNRSLKRFYLSHLSSLERKVLVYFRIIFILTSSVLIARFVTMFIYKWVWRKLDYYKLLATFT